MNSNAHKIEAIMMQRWSLQHRVTTVKTISGRWLFILHPIKSIQLVKHPVHGVFWNAGDFGAFSSA